MPEAPSGLPLFAGVDPSSREDVPTACCALSADGQVLDLSWARGNEEIARWLEGLGSVASVGLDGPLRLPRGLSPEQFFGADSEERRLRRRAELELAKRGIGCFFTTPRSFLRGWVERCLALGELLRGLGFAVLEVYPYATRRILWGTPRGVKKGWRSVRASELKLLRRMGVRWELEGFRVTTKSTPSCVR